MIDAIVSGFAVLDVLGPDGALFEKHEGKDAETKVVIHGRIVGVWSDHDGESREYHVEVERVDVEADDLLRS